MSFKILPQVLESLRKDSNSFNKFETVVSNPPYQLENASGADAIYQHFMNVAKIIGEQVSMIYPSKWTLGGRGEGMGAFRATEINSSNYVKFVVDSKEDALFKNAIIESGTNYFLWSSSNEAGMVYIYDEIEEFRKTLLNGKKRVIINPLFDAIVKRVQPDKTLKAGGSNYYGKHVSSDYKIDKYAEEKSDNEASVMIYYSGKGGGVRTQSISPKLIKKAFDDFKVFVSTTAHSKNSGLRRPDRMFLGKPNEICNVSFIPVGSFSSSKEAENCLLYLKTDFSTFLLGAICPTQHSYSKVYALIPDVDFATGEIKDKPGVFLDFSKPETLDDQLAKIYELTEDEQKLMKDSIRPWKDKLSLTADGFY